MRKYETLMLLSPELDGERRTEIVEICKEIIERDGKVDEVDDWGRRELAYPVQKQMRGHYIRLVHTSGAQTIAELERILRITDGMFKFLSVMLEEVEA